MDFVTQWNNIKQAHVRSRGADVVGGKGIPISTWSDVASVGSGFLKSVDAGVSRGVASAPDFARARRSFMATLPQERYGDAAIQFSKNATYPHNIEFWKAGSRLAIERNNLVGAPGVALPTQWELTKEFIGEESKRLNLPKPPGLTDIADLLKIGLLMAGAYAAYRIIER